MRLSYTACSLYLLLYNQSSCDLHLFGPHVHQSARRWLALFTLWIRFSRSGILQCVLTPHVEDHNHATFQSHVQSMEGNCTYSSVHGEQKLVIERYMYYYFTFCECGVNCLALVTPSLVTLVSVTFQGGYGRVSSCHLRDHPQSMRLHRRGLGIEPD